MSCKSFCSKILLFGEYSIIKDSMGLAISYPLFSGKLAFPSSTQTNPGIDHELKAFSHYLEKLKEKNELSIDIDLTSFKFDISQGLYFDSTIPRGFGVGSSGALCAALYHRYSKCPKAMDNIDDESSTFGELKRIFSLMESHFHGESSGIDPLISYLDRSILIMGKDDVGDVEVPGFHQGAGGMFLINTGRSRRTEPLVNHFLEKCNNPTFGRICSTVLLPITNGLITSFLEGDIHSLNEFFRELSDFQYRHFTPMIPPLFKDVWSRGLVSEDYYLKLCGAGGGGFMLGITKDFNKLDSILGQHEIRPLFYF